MTVEDAINAAMDVARRLAEGTLSPADVEAATVAECRALVGQVTGPQDACWPLQLEICRGVLAASGVPADELAEWLAAMRAAENATGVIPDVDADVDSDGPASTESDFQAANEHREANGPESTGEPL